MLVCSCMQALTGSRSACPQQGWLPPTREQRLRLHPRRMLAPLAKDASLLARQAAQHRQRHRPASHGSQTACPGQAKGCTGDHEQRRLLSSQRSVLCSCSLTRPAGGHTCGTACGQLPHSAGSAAPASPPGSPAGPGHQRAVAGSRARAHSGWPGTSPACTEMSGAAAAAAGAMSKQVDAGSCRPRPECLPKLWAAKWSCKTQHGGNLA